MLFAYIKLSDTFPNPASHTAPGFRSPGEYKWNPEYQDHILDGRLYNLEDEKDRADLNAACMNHMRVPHRYHFPVTVVVAKSVESGFDAPETVKVQHPLDALLATSATSLSPEKRDELIAWLGVIPATPEPQPRPGDALAARLAEIPPPASSGAKKKAHQLGVDLETLRGKGTGVGGLITIEDVTNAWRNSDGYHPEPERTGNLTMAEMLAEAEAAP